VDSGSKFMISLDNGRGKDDNVIIVDKVR